MANTLTPFEEYTLRNDAGVEIAFKGRLFSEGSYFDEENGALTRLKLYITDENRQVYSVVSGSGTEKRRQVYTLRVEDDCCHINNGTQSITLHTDMLLAAVFGLCGVDPAGVEGVKASLEEALKAANV